MGNQTGATGKPPAALDLEGRNLLNALATECNAAAEAIVDLLERCLADRPEQLIFLLAALTELMHRCTPEEAEELQELLRRAKNGG